MSSIVSATIDDSVLIDVSADASNSESINIAEFNGGTFLVPAAMTGTTLTFEGSLDDTTWDTVRGSNDTALSALTFTLSKIYHIPAAAFQYKFLRFVSNGTEAADRTIKVFLKG